MCTHGIQLLIVEQSCQSAVGVPFNTLVSYRLRRCATTHETKLLIVEQLLSVSSWGTFQHSCVLQAAKVCNDTGDKAVDC